MAPYSLSLLRAGQTAGIRRQEPKYHSQYHLIWDLNGRCPIREWGQKTGAVQRAYNGVGGSLEHL
jgi:hypothetical protein